MPAETGGESMEELDEVRRFGADYLGAFLYAFSKWLKREFEESHITGAFFLSREGALLKAAYETVDPEPSLPLHYLEVSRRALSVPLLAGDPDLGSFLLHHVRLPQVCTVRQLLTASGLSEEQILSFCPDPDETVRRDPFLDTEAGRTLLYRIQEDVAAGAEREAEALEEYLRQFSFSGNCAVVDVGWAGSMQRDLALFLQQTGQKALLTGFYAGLTGSAGQILGPCGLPAKGFWFDGLRDPLPRNHPAGQELALWEILLQEPVGSVRKYRKDGDKILQEREPFEQARGRELLLLIRNSAMDRVRDLCEKERAGEEAVPACCEDSAVFLREAGNCALRLSRGLGQLVFSNYGETVPLALPRPLHSYLKEPGSLLRDYRRSPWKRAFRRNLFGSIL